MQTDHLQQCMMMDNLGLVLERDCELKLQGDVISLVHYKGQCHSGLVSHVRSVTHIQETMRCPFVCAIYLLCTVQGYVTVHHMFLQGRKSRGHAKHTRWKQLCTQALQALHLFNPQLCNGR
jgi:hypothetical protein